MPRRKQHKPKKADLITSARQRGLKGSKALTRMNLEELRRLHEDATDVATDQDQTLNVMAGSAGTVLPQGGSGIRLATQPKPVKAAPKPGLQGSGTYREFVKANIKKHGGDMKAVAKAYHEQKGSGLIDTIENKVKQKVKDKALGKADALIDSHVHSDVLKAGLHAGVHAAADKLAGSGDMYGSGAADVRQYMEGEGFFDSLKKLGHKIQSSSVVRDLEKKAVNIGGKALRSVVEPAVDAVADAGVSLIGQPELAPLIDAGIHKGADFLQRKGTQYIDDKIDASGSGLGGELYGSGEADVRDHMDGGSVSEFLNNVAAGSSVAGLAAGATGIGATAMPFLEGAAGAAKVGSKIASLFGHGHGDVRYHKGMWVP